MNVFGVHYEEAVLVSTESSTDKDTGWALAKNPFPLYSGRKGILPKAGALHPRVRARKHTRWKLSSRCPDSNVNIDIFQIK